MNSIDKEQRTITGGIFIAEIAVNYTLAVIAKQQTSLIMANLPQLKDKDILEL